jgi:Fuc2NAc and GlcNAc transferase
MLSLLLLLIVMISWMLTGLLRRYAVSKNLLDIPNKRSSHVVPIPRGGGLAIVLTFFGGVLLLFIISELNSSVLFGLLGAGLLVAVVGFLDDHCHVSPKWRLLAHFSAVIWALAWFGEAPELSLFGYVVNLGWLGYVAIAVSLVWLLNLFNFMDGIDGIAASEAMFVAGSGFLFASLDAHAGLQFVAVILIGSTLGFLIWNWPPAKIFMGDVGSGFLGITLGIYN